MSRAPHLRVGPIVAGHERPGQDRLLVKRCPWDTRRVVSAARVCDAAADAAVESTRAAFPAWAARPLESRIATLQRFADALRQRERPIADLIVHETGKPARYALDEARALVRKIEVSMEIARRELVRHPLPDGTGWYDLHPIGVLLVLGPFNFPVHLSNGHIVPALLAGNTCVLKPSPEATGCAALWTQAWLAATADDPIATAAVALVPGDTATATRLAANRRVDGVMLTGSSAAGRVLQSLLAPTPERILVAEMGGRNATIIRPDADLNAAADAVVEAAFGCGGQRCTATSRVLVHAAIRDAFVEAVIAHTRAFPIGLPDAPETRMGPLTTEAGRDRFIAAQSSTTGLRTLLPGGAWTDAPTPGWWVLPAIHEVADRDGVAERLAEELFGPELLVESVVDDDDAAARVEATPYGLAASVFTRDADAFERLRARLRCGLVNWNRTTTGASPLLPFGGLGVSGNHRPAGSWSIWNCVWPKSTMRGDV